MFFVCGGNYVTNLGLLRFLLILCRTLESCSEITGNLYMSKLNVLFNPCWFYTKGVF